MTLRILVVDDHESARAAIKSILGNHADWQICGEASDGMEAIERAKELHPDAILMDVSMPRMDGLQATRAVREQVPETKVIIVSQNDPAVVRQQAAQAGAHAYVGKDAISRDLIPSVEKLFPDASSVASTSDVTPPTGRPAEDISTWLPGGGEMGELIRNTDWARTPLGASTFWSPALRMIVKFLLANRFPQLLWWGPEFCSVYNDAYIPILGTKHPWALGRPVSEVWKEIWHVLKPLIETPFSGGPATWMEDIPLEINRKGFFEETHFTIAYSPVPDESVLGGIGGVLATVHEITEKVVGERRVRALRDLGARSVEPRSVEEACNIIRDTLAAHSKDIPFLLLYLLDEKRQNAQLASCNCADRSDRACPQSIDLNSRTDQMWPLSDVLATEEIQFVPDLKSRFDEVPQGPWSDAPTSAAVLPIRSNIQHQLAGFMVAGLSSRIQFDKSYRDFLELMSTQIATTIANARAYEEERKRSEALAEIDRVKTLFFSNVSHEFRTPLTLMLGPLEDALSSNGGLGDEQRRNLEVAHRNSLRLLKLVNTLLDFSRIEAGRIQASYEPTDLASLTVDLASVFRSAIERAGIKLLVNCPSTTESTYVDREMWEKIVFNLLSNAFKFTFQGEIEVLVKPVGGDSVELTVKDTGTGIPDEDIPHLFERFYRVEGARGRSWEGSGIGLALVQELAKLHGGSVRVESKLDHGSSFIVSIPIGKDHLPPDRIGAARTLASSSVSAEAYIEESLHWSATSQDISDDAQIASLIPGSTPSLSRRKSQDVSRILLADDNADMRGYIKNLLDDRYEVIACPDGRAALESAQQERPDLVLADVMMPRMNGFELLRAIREDKDLRSTPVILLSARAGEESRIEGLDAGADDYLAKPFSARELRARVASHLAIAKVRHETADLERKLRAEAELERSRLQHEIADIKLLQGVSAHLIYEENVSSLYEKILDAAVAIMGSDYATMQAFYPERGKHGELRMLAHRGLTPEAAKFWEWVRGDSGCTCGQVLRTGKRAIAVDVKTCEFMVGTPDQAAYLKANIHAGQSTPLFSRSGKILGMISTHWRNPHEPSERDLRLLDILARQAADLIERMQAQKVLRDSEERFRALVNATSYVVYRMNSDWSEMRQLEGRGFISDTGKPRTDWLEEYIHPDDRELILRTIREAVRTKSMFQLEHRIRRTDGSLGWTYSRAVPLLDESGKIIEWFGAATDVTARKEAEENYRKLAHTLDAEVRARTRDLEERNTEILRQAEQVRELSWRLLRTQDEERRHIARELHDSAGQTLTVLGINLAQLLQKAGRTAPDLATDAEAIQEMVQQLHRDIRTTSYLLHPPLLDECGLSSALMWYTEGLAERSGLQIDLDISQEFGRLPRDMELVVFRLVQECLTNIHRHSGSKTGSIRIAREEGNIAVDIRDTGKGMSPERLNEIQSSGSGVGIRGMRERLRQFKGEMKIESDPAGTRILVTIPVTRSTAVEDDSRAESLPTAV